MKQIFISYAHEDAAFRQALVVHLEVLRAAGIIESWHDGELQPGDDWKAAIDRKIEAADIVILLVSASFLASRACQDIELAPALKRWEAKRVVILPVIVRSCDWEASTIGRLQVLPSQGRPVVTWPHPDDAWTEVTRKIREIASPGSPTRSAGRPEPFPVRATLQSRSGLPVPPLTWQLRAAPTDEIDLTKSELHDSLRASVVTYDLGNFRRTARWPIVLVAPQATPRVADDYLWVRAYTGDASNEVLDEQIGVNLSGTVTFQRSTLWDSDRISLDFGAFAFDTLNFLKLLEQFAARLSLRNPLDFTTTVWFPHKEEGVTALFYATPVAPEQYDRAATFMGDIISRKSRIQVGQLADPEQRLVVCKRLLDRVANEFHLEPDPFRQMDSSFLALSLESLRALAERLS